MTKRPAISWVLKMFYRRQYIAHLMRDRINSTSSEPLYLKDYGLRFRLGLVVWCLRLGAAS